eukprot:680304-Rhodomonas_salina.1
MTFSGSTPPTGLKLIVEAGNVAKSYGDDCLACRAGTYKTVPVRSSSPKCHLITRLISNDDDDDDDDDDDAQIFGAEIAFDSRINLRVHVTTLRCLVQTKRTVLPGSGACTLCGEGKYSGAGVGGAFRYAVYYAILTSSQSTDSYCINDATAHSYAATTVLHHRTTIITATGSTLYKLNDAATVLTRTTMLLPAKWRVPPALSTLKARPVQRLSSYGISGTDVGYAATRSPLVQNCTCNAGRYGRYAGKDGTFCFPCSAGTYKPLSGSQPTRPLCDVRYRRSVWDFPVLIARMELPGLPRMPREYVLDAQGTDVQLHVSGSYSHCEIKCEQTHNLVQY